MKNVFDIKREKALNFILPQKVNIGGVGDSIEKTLVVIHLYYIDQIEQHIKYIKNIPSQMDLLITVSSKHMLSILDVEMKSLNRKYEIVLKPNRGRDVSSLLVTARKKILQYEFVCFIHDKKEKNEILKNDIAEWNYCLWENTVASSIYIQNVLCTFMNNKKIGLLAPPSIITENLSHGYKNTWLINFENTREIIEKFNLKCNLDKDKSPIVLGTVFWARVDSIRKLLKNDWQYEDFDDEPLAADGRLSHAIERVLPFFAQDSGYETGWIMTEEYAARRIEKDTEILENAFELLRKIQNVTSVSQLKRRLNNLEPLFSFCNKFSSIYIYGAGDNGKTCFKLLVNIGVEPKKFLVSKLDGNPERVYGVMVNSFNDVSLDKDSGIIIAVQEKYRNEILKKLILSNVLQDNIYVFDCN